jgi:hypothetical protein
MSLVSPILNGMSPSVGPMACRSSTGISERVKREAGDRHGCGRHFLFAASTNGSSSCAVFVGGLAEVSPRTVVTATEDSKAAGVDAAVDASSMQSQQVTSLVARSYTAYARPECSRWHGHRAPTGSARRAGRPGTSHAGPDEGYAGR